MMFERLRLAGAGLADGEIALARRAGRGGTVVFCHANGLNASAYRPMLDALDIHEAILAPDARGHGRTRLAAAPRALTSWTRYADDLAAILAAVAPEPPLTLVGHSMGAVTALLAAASGPPPARLVMIEPVVVPRLARLGARLPVPGLMPRLVPIARRAARRRAAWPDVAAARDALGRSAFFGRWDPAALAGYLDDGLVASPNGVRLSCEPAWEAASFAAQAHRFWRPLRRTLERGVPVHVLHAETGSTVPADAARRLALAGCAVTRAGGDHMLPLHRPADAAAFVRLALRGGWV